MKQQGEIEEHIFRWLNEGYTIPQIHKEMDKAVMHFRKVSGYHNVDEYYKE